MTFGLKKIYNLSREFVDTDVCRIIFQSQFIKGTR